MHEIEKILANGFFVVRTAALLLDPSLNYTTGAPISRNIEHSQTAFSHA